MRPPLPARPEPAAASTAQQSTAQQRESGPKWQQSAPDVSSRRPRSNSTPVHPRGRLDSQLRFVSSADMQLQTQRRDNLQYGCQFWITRQPPTRRRSPGGGWHHRLLRACPSSRQDTDRIWRTLRCIPRLVRPATSCPNSAPGTGRRCWPG